MTMSETVPSVDHYYGNLQRYVKQICWGLSDLLILEAGAGIGKSYQIETTMEQYAKGPTKTVAGYISPMQLHKALYDARHEDSVLFLDDVSGLEDERAMESLKAATWSTDGERRVAWSSTTNKLDDNQKEFTFKGRLIICTNDLSSNAHMEAVLSRGKVYHMDFDYHERMEIIREVAKAPYTVGEDKPHVDIRYDTSLDERMEVAEWIDTFTDETTHSKINLRMLFHCLDNLGFCQVDEDTDADAWKDLSSDLFTFNEDLSLVQQLMRKHASVKDARNEFEERTGLSRSTFFNRKRNLEERLGSKLKPQGETQ